MKSNKLFWIFVMVLVLSSFVFGRVEPVTIIDYNLEIGCGDDVKIIATEVSNEEYNQIFCNSELNPLKENSVCLEQDTNSLECVLDSETKSGRYYCRLFNGKDFSVQKQVDLSAEYKKPGIYDVELENRDLYAHFKFDGNYKNSGAGRISKINPYKTKLVNGLSGKAVRFDGVKSRMDLKTASKNYGILNPTKRSTGALSVWVRPAEGNNGQIYAEYASYSFRKGPQAGVISLRPYQFAIHNRGTSKNKKSKSYPKWHAVSRPVKPVANEWNFYVITYTGSEMYFYINGVKQKGDWKRARKEHSYASSFGALFHHSRSKRGHVYRYFKGDLDDLRIYNRFLSEEQIKEYYEKVTVTQFICESDFVEIDKDGDGVLPLNLGGKDCDDEDINVYLGAREILDGKDNDCDGFVDSDDFDFDSDEDGVPDRIENKFGSSSGDVSIEANGIDQLSVEQEEDESITFRDEDDPLVEVPPDTKGDSVEITKNEEGERGSIETKGFDLPEGETKTVYVPKRSDATHLCIFDTEEAPEKSQIRTCSGGVKLPCPGELDGYTCTLEGDQYKISGLKHTYVVEFNDQDGDGADDLVDTSVDMGLPTISGFASDNIRDALIAYYPFEGNANDVSGNNNHGVVRGSVTWENAKNGKGARTGSGNWIDIDAINDDVNVNAGTFAAWVNMDNYASGRYETFFAFYKDASNRIFFEHYPGNFMHNMHVAGGRSVGDGCNQCQTFFDVARFSGWHYFAMTWDKSKGELKTYIDGNLISTTVATHGALQGSFTDSAIGAHGQDTTSWNEFLFGVVDEVKIFGRALTAGEVRKDYQFKLFEEECNGEDDDYDGDVDEGACPVLNYYCDSDEDGVFSLTVSETCNTFECTVEGCVTEPGTDCDDTDPDRFPRTEITFNEAAQGLCDEKDNDCDTYVDENCVCLNNEERTTSCGVGVCEVTITQECEWGQWPECTPDVTDRGDEVCDAIDHNCDGSNNLDDDGEVLTTIEGCNQQGVCAGAFKTCSAEGSWEECSILPGVEDCDAVGDEDCDGFADAEDDDCCECFDTLCQAGNTGIVCNGCKYVTAPHEICNDNIDNDCDGLVDYGIDEDGDGYGNEMCSVDNTESLLFDFKVEETIPLISVSDENIYYKSSSTFSNGEFIISWTQNENINFQIFNPDGTEKTDIIETNIDNNQDLANVVVETFSNGNFVIAWQSDVNGFDENDVFARIFNNDGSPKSDEFLVNQFTYKDQKNPDIVIINDDEFIVSWQHFFDPQHRTAHELEDLSRRFGSGIYIQKFDADGNYVGEDFTVYHAYPELYSYSITAGSYGNIVSSWRRRTDPTTGGYYKLFDSNFNIIVDETTIGEGVGQIISAVSSQNEFVIVWSEADNVFSGESKLYAKIFNSDGTAKTDKIIIDPNEKFLSNKFVDIDSNNNILILWDTIEPSNKYISVQVLNLEGEKYFEQPFKLESIEKINRIYTSLDLIEGKFIVSWMTKYENQESGIYSKIIPYEAKTVNYDLSTYDCDDDDVYINHGFSEACRDGKDNDCDGNVDEEDFDCVIDEDVDQDISSSTCKEEWLTSICEQGIDNCDTSNRIQEDGYCCGDDDNEHYSFREGYVFNDQVRHVDWPDNMDDTACCDDSNDCVMNGICYSSTSSANMPDYEGLDKVVSCSSSKWNDCDYNTHYCSYCGLPMATFGEDAGEATKGEQKCCGDDADEYLISENCGDSSGVILTACCDNENDKINKYGNCVGECFVDMDNDGYDANQDCDDNDAGINPDADEICDDEVDNDCDNKIDNEDEDCFIDQDSSSSTCEDEWLTSLCEQGIDKCDTANQNQDDGYCCGDDDNEYYIFRGGYVFNDQVRHVDWLDNTDDNACCDSNTDCVMDGVCYSSASGADVLNYNGLDKRVACSSSSSSSKWYDCDSNIHYCSYCGLSMIVFGEDAGEATKGEKKCCGDDSGEFVITEDCFGNTVSSASSICCDNENDKIKSNKCVSECESCGDGSCDIGETKESCPEDCRLFAYYEFEDNVEDSAESNNGVVHGSPEFIEGKKGKALKLNGPDDYVEVQDSFDFDIYGGMTYDFWFNLDSSDHHTAYLLRKVNPKVVVRDGLLSFTLQDFSLSAKTGIEDNKWYHVVITHNSDNLRKIYINGALEESETSSGDLPDYRINPNLLIGGSILSFDHPFRDAFVGLIDELKIYNYALSEEEVKASYESIVPPVIIDTDDDGISDEVEAELSSTSDNIEIETQGVEEFKINKKQDGSYSVNDKENRMLDLPKGTKTKKVKITKNQENDRASIRTTGLDLPEDETKTVYVPKRSTVTYLCIFDTAEPPERSQLRSCTGGVKLPCPGELDDYTCTSEGNQYKISGLKHTFIMEFVDDDYDGFDVYDDCDDTNPNINPDADEVCDGVDNNCVDGTDDEDCCVCETENACHATDLGKVCNGCVYVNAPAENCDVDGDEDCDGFADEDDEDCLVTLIGS